MRNLFRKPIEEQLILFSAFFTGSLLLLIFITVFKNGLLGVNWTFLTTVTSKSKGTVGIAGNIVNTLYLVVITLLFSVPIGIASAIYLNEYAKDGKLVQLIRFSIETLSAIPSIIFGLFGMVVFGEFLHLGYSLLSGCLTLSIMVLPLIIRNTEEALKTVPDRYRFGAIALGAGKWHMIYTVILPNALSGIVTGILLAIGRIVGESAALLFTAGSAKSLPKVFSRYPSKIFESGGSLTVQLYLSANSEGDFSTAYSIALVLLIIALLLNILTKVISKKLRK